MFQEKLREVGVTDSQITAINFEHPDFVGLTDSASEVYIGMIDGREIDFVTRDGGEVRYWQVAETLRGEETRKRELAALKAIHDHYPKTVLSLDQYPVGYEDGIKTMNALDFLLGFKTSSD